MSMAPDETERRPVPPWERVSFLSADQIRSHPRFQDAHDCFVDELLSLYGDDRRLLRSLVEYVRAVSFMMIVCLDATYDPDDPSSHVTLAQLHTVLAPMGITDKRRIANIVTGLELDGFLNSRTVAARPPRAYPATDRKDACGRPRMACGLSRAAGAAVPGSSGLQGGDGARSGHQLAYRKVSLSTVGFAQKIVGANPAIGFFLSHDVGIRVLMVLMSMVRGKIPPRAPFGFYTVAAERAGVSRTHVRNLMHKAAELGLVVLPVPSRRFLEVLPPLQEAVTRWIADSLSGVDLVCRLAEMGPARRDGEF